VEAVSQSRLKEIQALFGGHCEIIGTFDKHSAGSSGKSNSTEILALLERRAMTLDGLTSSQNTSRESIVESLRTLKDAGLIVSFIHQDVEHYRAKEAAKAEQSQKRAGGRLSK
jgi:biotin operon repressor